MKIAILNDTHCGVRNSSDIFIEYQRRFYEEVFFPYLLENDITTILHLGDYYENRSTINFKALRANREHFLDLLRKYNIHMDIIPGNHDVYYKSTNELCSLKELLGHYMNEVNIVMKPRVMDYDGTKIALLPWINPQNEKESMKFLRNCKADILAAHLEIKGFDMYRGIPCQEGMDPSVFSNFKTVLSGHFHTKSERGNILYLGAQMEFFWNDVDDPKYFHVLDTKDESLEEIENPLTIFKRVYYDEDKKLPTDYAEYDKKFVKIIVENKTDQAKFDSFIDNIQLREIYDLKISEVIEGWAGSSIDDNSISLEDVQTLMNSFVDATETSLDKDRLKFDLSKFYNVVQTSDLV